MENVCLKIKTNIVYNKSCTSMPELPDNSIDCIITSPPYWGLRDYGVDNQIGLEPTLREYLDKLLIVTAECKRVLKPTGVVWWNHGDCYSAKRWSDTPSTTGKSRKCSDIVVEKEHGLPDKCMVLQNYRLIIRLIDEQGWILRNTAIWSKPNAMPSSVKDRLTNKYEPVFFLVKNTETQYYWNEKTGSMADRKPKVLKEGIDWDWQEVGVVSENTFNVRVRDADKGRFMEGATETEKKDYGKSKRKKKTYWHSLDYWFDLDAIRESYTKPLDRWGGDKLKPKARVCDACKGDGRKIPWPSYDLSPCPKCGGEGIIIKRADWDKGTGQTTYRDRDMRPDKSGKNPGDVWTIPTQPYPEAHFATFPERLVIRPILSSCPEWICKKCGKARVRISKIKSNYIKRENAYQPNNEPTKVDSTGWKPPNSKTIGWTHCGCKNLTCMDCGYIIEDREVKEYATQELTRKTKIQKGMGSQAQRLSEKILSGGNARQASKKISFEDLRNLWQQLLWKQGPKNLHSEVRGSTSNQTRQSQQLSEGETFTELQRREHQQRRIQNDNGKDKGQVEKIDGTQSNNGKASSETIKDLGRSSPQERDKSRQQNPEFGISSEENSSGEDALSFVWRMVQGKVKCSKCHSNNLKIRSAGWRPGITLDLFAGSGTTLAMAKRYNRQYIGYEISKDYIPLIQKRLAKEDTLFNRKDN